MEQKSKNLLNFIVNNLLFLSGIVMTVSGLVLQIGFHIGNHGGGHGRELRGQAVGFEYVQNTSQGNMVWGIRHHDWLTIHKIAIVIFTLLMIYHIVVHWKWYKCVLTKRLAGKNIQVITLSILFLIVAITGLIPWFIHLSGGENSVRNFMIELHDKFALIMIIYLILHLMKRFKWFSNTYKRLKI